MLGCEDVLKLRCASSVECLLGGAILIQALLNSYHLALADVRAAVEELPKLIRPQPEADDKAEETPAVDGPQATVEPGK